MDEATRTKVFFRLVLPARVAINFVRFKKIRGIMSLETKQAAECASVIMLAKCYVAVHAAEGCIRPISDHPEIDLKVAQAAAESFAKANKIVYNPALKSLSKPIMTVIQRKGKWFPAELHPDKIRILQKCMGINAGSDKEAATAWAHLIACVQEWDCIPSIGISLEEKS